MIDISIYESGDGGEFILSNNDLQVVDSFTNTVYLALFGGNIEQNTNTSISEEEERSDWWGNELLELDYNSNFERALYSVALNSAGIKALEEAAKKDLSILSEYGEVSVSISSEIEDRMELMIIFTERNSKEKKIKFIFDKLKNEVIQEAII